MTYTDEKTLKHQDPAMMTKLRRDTCAYHKKLESLPYFSKLIEHRLPLECYVSQLRTLAVIYLSALLAGRRMEVPRYCGNLIRSRWLMNIWRLRSPKHFSISKPHATL